MSQLDWYSKTFVLKTSNFNFGFVENEVVAGESGSEKKTQDPVNIWVCLYTDSGLELDHILISWDKWYSDLCFRRNSNHLSNKMQLN